MKASLKLSDELVSSVKDNFRSGPAIKSSVDQALSNLNVFLETLSQAILAELERGNLKYEAIQKKCEKCGRDVIEHRITIVCNVVDSKILKIKLQVVLKALWDTNCGLSYFRVSLKG